MTATPIDSARENYCESSIKLLMKILGKPVNIKCDEEETVNVGDLVTWPQGYCDTPGLVLDTRPSKSNKSATASMNPTGMAVLAILPELGNDPEWFHECELELIS